MPDTNHQANPKLVRLSKLIKAPRQRVYDAWLDPDIRKQWWHASPAMACTQYDIDAKVGGSYRINMTQGDNEYVTVGEFLELNPPSRIAFSWTWEKPMDGVVDSLVCIDLYEVEHEGETATELVLTHTKLSTAGQRDSHSHGWTGCLASLAEHLAPAPTETTEG